MYKPHYASGFLKAIALTFCILMLMQCTEESFMVLNEAPEITISAASTTTVSPADCSTCTYVVPSNAGTSIVDGKLLNLQPGSVICLSAQNSYVQIIFRNIVGSSA